MASNRQFTLVLSMVIGFFAPSLFQGALASTSDDPALLVDRYCGGCHQAKPGVKASWSRIAQQRKTPEGWLMSVVRMQILGRNVLSEDERRDLVKYLADTRGLAPSESRDYRYILEQRHNTVEQFEDQDFATTCARCHSGARVALQRRSEEEWSLLGHFHLGQWPSAEFSGSGRTIDFLKTVTETLPSDYLIENYPLYTREWDEWQKTEKPELAGNWRLFGRMPGKGDFHGVMEARETGPDRFSLSLTGEYQDGEKIHGKGTGLVYTGYEWRASIDIGGMQFKQVFASDPAGKEMTGRMFMTHHEERGVSLTAVKHGGSSRVLAISPDYLQRGSEATLVIVGTSLSGEIDLGPQVDIAEIVSRDENRVVVRAKANADASAGFRKVAVGKAILADSLTVYDSIDSVQVVPALAVARVGGNGGPIPKVNATFQALAFAAGPDGKADTDDDLRIGYVPAQWSVKPFDEQAAHDKDVKFAGVMNKDSGTFTPALAGPNEKRVYNTNNAGNLSVVAQVGQGDEVVTAQGRLVVTVQRWNNPPIR